MLYLTVGIVAVALAIYSMINISTSEMDKPKKMMWFAIVVLLPIVGPLTYYLIRPNQAVQG